MPCPFAGLLGNPGEGFHEARFAGVALNDTVATFALAWATSRATGVSLAASTIGWFALAESLHYAFGVKTAVLERLGVPGLDCEPTIKNEADGRNADESNEEEGSEEDTTATSSSQGGQCSEACDGCH